MTPRPSPAPPYVGLRLYKERTRRGWSLCQAGDASGVARTTVSLAEQGRDIRMSTLLALAGAYGISLDALTAEPGCGRCLDWGECPACGRGGVNGKTISDGKETTMTTTTCYHPDPEINAEVIADAIEAERADLAAGYDPRRWRCTCGAEHSRGHFGAIGVHRCLACGYVGAGGVMLDDDETGEPTL